VERSACEDQISPVFDRLCRFVDQHDATVFHTIQALPSLWTPQCEMKEYWPSLVSHCYPLPGDRR